MRYTRAETYKISAHQIFNNILKRILFLFNQKYILKNQYNFYHIIKTNKLIIAFLIKSEDLCILYLPRWYLNFNNFLKKCLSFHYTQ